MELNICHLYPDVLNLYGDRGNVLCMEKRLQWRGIQCAVEGVGIGQTLDASRYDLFFIGGGQSFELDVLLSDFKGLKANELKAAIEDEKPLLAVCGGFELLGNYHKALDGTQNDYAGLLDMYTVEQEQRMIGDYMFTCDDLNGEKIIAFENHAGRTYLGNGVRPVGQVVYGHGNNGEDGYEGARYKKVFGTYGHGCLLPKNPAVADLMLQWALERKYPGAVLSQLDDQMERCAHKYMENRLHEVSRR